MRLRPLAVLAVLVALAACRDGGAEEPLTTVPTAPTTASTTSTTAVSFDVPATIDIPYIEKVMAALDHADGEAARYAAAKRQLDEPFLSRLAAIYGGDALDLTKQGWYEVAGNNFELLEADPGDPDTTVQQIISTSSECVLFAADRDFSKQFVSPDPAGPQRYIALVRKPAGVEGEKNPTPWIMNFDGNFSDDHVPASEEVCVSP